MTLGACGSSAAKTSAPTVTDAATTIPRTPGPKGSLDFREVQAQFPWTAEPSTAPTAPGQTPYPGCAKLIEQSRKQKSDQQAVLPARDRKSCYTVGPVLVDGASVDEVGVVYDATASQWVVNVHFANDDFLDKIAGPLANTQITIDLDGIVQSAPTVNPGITGHDVEITGGYTTQQAIDAAARIAGLAPSSVTVDPTGAPE
jgi:preprotein translocase subunit SecD